MEDKNTTEEEKVPQGLPSLNSCPRNIDRKLIELLPEDIARGNRMIFFEKEKGVYKVAMVNPDNLQSLNILRFVSKKNGIEFERYVATEEVIEEMFKFYQDTEKAVKDVVRSFKDEKEELESKRKEEREDSYQKLIQDAPVSKLAKVIITHAIEAGASDIHIEPTTEGYRVRFRVDGVLHASLVTPRDVGKAIVSRIKILSNLKIDETRKPQDGRFSLADEDEGEEGIDFRVSTFPVVGGEKVVLRILEKDDNVLTLKDLGVVGRNGEVLSRATEETNGIILMTGPTGSGKSTTLYALLQSINQEERNIVTLEDPVEYSIAGINQSQINPEIGYTFANGLRSILRQDPNVIMVGEIRDSETAELAIHASLTGHLVFSTLHTNSALGSIPRLVDMGIEPFLMASSIRVLAAQRLVRKICSKCKVEERIPTEFYEKIKGVVSEIDPAEIEKYGVDISGGLKFFKGQGCEDCGNLGLKGRVAISECFEIDNDAKDAISSEKRDELLRDIAKKQGMITMKQDGVLKALKGLTTLSEVERITEGSLSVGGAEEDDRG
ncbi:GspE/PulE family protein [Patescibacteria group bacterium]